MSVYELKIEGMTCGHCVRAVQQALSSVPGVRKADVEVGHAHVEADDTVTREKLVDAIDEEGYRVVA